MIKTLIITLALLALLLLFVAALTRRSPRTKERIRLVAKPLMTPAERENLVHLEQAAPSCRVHAQVAMGALMRPERGLGRGDRAHWRNRFSQKIVDFVLEDRATGKVVALVELDDSTHLAERDAARDRMTAACGYRTVRLSCSPRLTATSVTATLAEAIAEEGAPRGAVATPDFAVRSTTPAMIATLTEENAT